MNLLGASHLVDFTSAVTFASKCQSRFGGFSKHATGHPDPLHSYMGLAGLSLMGHPEVCVYIWSLLCGISLSLYDSCTSYSAQIAELDPALNISRRASAELYDSRSRLPDLADGL